MATAPGAAQNYIDPRNYAIFVGTERRERIAGNVSLQWAPASDDGMFYMEGTVTDRSGWDETFSPNIIDNSVLRQQEEIDIGGFRVDDTQQIVGFTDNDAVLINRTESGFRNTRSFSGAIGGEWQFSKLNVAGEVSYANSDTNTPYSDLRFWGLDAAAQAAAQAAASPVDPADFGNPSDVLRSLDVTVLYDTDNESLPTVDLANEALWLDRDVFALRRYESREGQIDNTETAARLDFSYDEPFSGFSLIESFDFGGRITSRSFESSRKRLFVGNIQRDLVDLDTGNRRSIYMSEFAPGLIQDFDFDVFRDIDGAFDLGEFTMFDPSIVRDQARTQAIVEGLLAGTNKEAAVRAGQQEELGRFAGIDEDTIALYAQFNLDGDLGTMPFSAVAGVRYVDTSLTSSAFQRENGEFVPVSLDNDYDDWLPSANISVNVQEDVILRLAAAKVLRRPDFGQLSPALNVNQDAVFATRGNPNLEPFRATQYDASIEKYWGKGNLISAAVFYKDVSSFFDETEICLNAPNFVAISNPNRRDELCFLDGRGGNPVNPNDPGAVPDPDSALGIPTEIQINGDSGTVKGFELGYQHAFDFLPGFWSGFGINANYTYADSEDPNGRPLEDISKNSYNLTGYYERDGFSARLAYTYRDRFLDDILNGRVRQLGALLADGAVPDPTQGNSFREPIKQLDASVSYDINEMFTIQADAVNLTGEQIFDTGTTGTLWRVLESDRRYSVGLRAKF
ncbi:TonB-dependent receptor [Litorimonas sp. RW-G-Af-16]|uniref:TonB-dependent receptor n=1 Tax=Litorimonas sp. RW-G-Af-16 TaxID=3241168 RepID=UPI003AAD8A22